ncbi:NAD(P)/FAD-dependent oxidoreductase [Saccharomonospora xinjiangensis]|uniref:FAD-dependent oxidoreductase n=1 Tax=Saccharomonospora xinjiangensis TaxID=75294 RepID=UPI0010701121|nr:NAD(P)/FAD-dependent oxidoreductase [Saccharomonospora xinjiangensis]QBQ59918.1 FAD-dependent urate hydroxylase [Saccharomonospora xinjiangensis]
MKVVIIGAGFGGMAAAIWLAEAGHEIELYEQAPQIRASGNGVLLLPNGTGLLRELGVDLDGLGARMDSVDGLFRDGSRAIRVKLSKIAQRHGAPVLVGSRGRVAQRLAARLPEGALRVNMRCTGIEYTEDGPVAVSFADGTETKADLVIGADGQRSVVRTALFGEDPAVYLGDATWHGITRLPGAFAEGHAVHSVFGDEGICVMHPVGDGEVYWAFELPFSDGDVLPPGAPGDTGSLTGEGSAVANLRARFGSWTAPGLPELLAAMRDEDVSVFPHIIHRELTQWGKGAVTLVGDAAHVVPPRVGMGLSQALEDAWVLSRAVAGSDDVVARIRAYEQARIRRVRGMQKAARMLGRKTVPMPPWLLRRVGKLLPVTKFNEAQVRNSSNYLNNDLAEPADLVTVAEGRR